MRVDLNERREHEIAMRRDDIKALKVKVDALLEQSKHVEEESDPVVVDLFRNNKLIANHEATIKAILEQRSKLVHYEMRHCKSTLTLQLGVISKVSRSFLCKGDAALQRKSFSRATSASSRATSCSVATPSIQSIAPSKPSKLPSVALLSSSFPCSSQVEDDEHISLVWTIEPVCNETADTSTEVSTESACEELPVVNGAIQPKAVALVIFEYFC
jgi:hypothetical protein